MRHVSCLAAVLLTAAVSLAQQPSPWVFSKLENHERRLEALERKAGITAAAVASTPAASLLVFASAATHSHRCPTCGFVWSHSDASHGNATDHTCPNCKRTLPLPWHKIPTVASAPVIQSAPVVTTTTMTAPVVTTTNYVGAYNQPFNLVGGGFQGGGCPGGVCPTGGGTVGWYPGKILGRR